MTSARSLCQQILGCNPYDGFDRSEYEFDPQGWGHRDPIFDIVIASLRPRIILEVGSWKGASAIRMAQALRAQGTEAAIICIDTWLGSLEHLDGSASEGVARYRRHGYPQIYYQFLANVLHAGVDDLIVPFPTTSATGARFLSAARLRADLVYLDGSHQEEDVYTDIVLYWRLLRRGGILLGDDWDSGPMGRGVQKAVRRFAREQRLRVEAHRYKWLLTKPPARRASRSSSPGSQEG